MNPWIKTVFVGIATVVVAFTYLFILPIFITALAPDPFGEALLPLVFLLALALQCLALFSAWIFHRCLFKKSHNYIIAVLLAVSISFGTFLIFLRVTVSHWWEPDCFMFFGFLPAIFCGIPLLYLLFCKKRDRQ